MKKYLKILVIMTLSMGLFLCAASASYAATDYFKMTKSGNSSYTVSWHYTQGDFEKSNYKITGWYITGKDGAIIKEVNNPSATSMTISNLKRGYTNHLSLYYRYTYDNQSSKFYVNSCYVNTKPKTIQKSAMSVPSASISNGTVDIKVGSSYDVNYQLKLYNVKSGKCVKTITQSSPYFFNVSVASNKLYKYKARSYIVNNTDNKKYYGDWSKYRYFVSPKVYIVTNSSKKGCTLKIKGVSGISKYKIYVSTSNNSKGKLTKTVKPTVGKTKAYRVTKIGKNTMKKYKTYYVTIVPYVKATGKQSDVMSRGSFMSY